MNAFQVKKRCSSQRNTGAAQEALKVIETLKKLMFRFFALLQLLDSLHHLHLASLHRCLSKNSDQVSSYLLN